MKQNLTIAIKAALAASGEILKIYATNFAVENKGDNSPLTIADKNANNIIVSYLKGTGIPIISEENKQVSYANRKEWKQCWIVDPLDGTKEFVKRNGEFTVNIALVSEGIPVLGVIYVPVSKTLYFTNSNQTKSFKIKLESDDKSIGFIFENAKEIKPISHERGVVKIAGSRSHQNDETRQFIASIEATNDVAVVSRGSSLKFCMIAEGEAHLYPRFAPSMEWDTAAGQAICQAAGVAVIDNNTGQPLLYNKENLLNPYFLVKKQ